MAPIAEPVIDRDKGHENEDTVTDKAVAEEGASLTGEREFCGILTMPGNARCNGILQFRLQRRDQPLSRNRAR